MESVRKGQKKPGILAGLKSLNLSENDERRHPV